MRILFLVESLFNSSGIERITTSLINLLSNDGYEVAIVICNPDRRMYYSLDQRVATYFLDANFSQKFLCRYRFYKCIKGASPDIIVNVSVQMAQISLPVAFVHKVKVVTWEHFHLKAGSKKGYLFRLLSSMLSNRTVVLTKKDKSKYPVFLQRRIDVIYNFSILQNDRNYHREKEVIAVGRLTYQKSFDRLIIVWSSLMKKIKNWHLTIIGDGELREDLQKMIQSEHMEQYISIVPATKDIESYYKRASLLFMTSRFEGMPMVLIEAKQFGIPCISYDCPNGPDEIIVDDSDGYIVQDGNVIKFVEKAEILMNDERKRAVFSRNAEVCFQDKFTSGMMLLKWCNLFKSLVYK